MFFVQPTLASPTRTRGSRPHGGLYEGFPASEIVGLWKSSRRSGTLPPLLPVSTRHTLRTRHSGSGRNDETISAFFGCRNTASSRDVLESASCCADLEDRRDEHAANPGPRSFKRLW